MKYTDIDFNGKTILITGGAGFIGSNLAFYFQSNFPSSKVTLFDCFRSNKTFNNGNLRSLGHYKNLIGFNGNIVTGNISSKEDIAVLDEHKFDFIFHHAAISDTRADDQETIMKTNVNSFYFLLELAKKNNSVLVYASSAATYGNLSSPQSIGYESPENAYGFSKYMMDQIALKYSEINPKLKIVGLRFFNVYGHREFYKGKTSSMIIQLGHQILNGNPPRLFENSSQLYRDFIYIDDVIQANVKACNASKNGIYNVGTGIARSFLEVSDILQQELKTEFKTEFFPNPFRGYQKHTQADISSTKKNLSFEPQFSLEQGIKAYLPEIKRLHGYSNL